MTQHQAQTVHTAQHIEGAGTGQVIKMLRSCSATHSAQCTPALPRACPSAVPGAVGVLETLQRPWGAACLCLGKQHKRTKRDGPSHQRCDFRGQLKVWAARRSRFVEWQPQEQPGCPCLFLCPSLVLALRWEQAAATYLGDQAGPVRGQGFQILLLRRFCFPLISLKGPDNEEWLIKQHRLLLGSAAPCLLRQTPSQQWGWGFESHA